MKKSVFIRSVIVIIFITWCLYIVIGLVSPQLTHQVFDISSERWLVNQANIPTEKLIPAKLLDNSKFYPDEIWGDGTVFRWNKKKDLLTLPPTTFTYSFVSFRGMTYVDDSRYLVQFTDAQPQELIFHGMSHGFRINRLLFISKDTLWNIDNSLVFSMTPVEFKPVIINERSLSVAISNMSVNVIRQNNPPLLETLFVFFLMIVIIVFIDYSRHQILGIVLSILTPVIQIWANHNMWSYATRVIFWTVIGMVTLHHLKHWHRFVRFLFAELGISWPRHVKHHQLFRLFIIIIIPFIWIWTSSFILYDRWQWNVRIISPTPLILAGFIAWPLLSIIIYVILNVRKYHPVTLLFFGLYTTLGVLLFTQIAPGCYPPDTLHTLSLAIKGSWHEFYSSVHLPILTSFMQIIPWGTHGLFIFHLLIWIVTFTFMHTILFRQRSHMVYHLILPTVLITPVSLLIIMNPMHHTTFTGIFLLFLLLFYTLVKFQKFSQYKYIVGISIIGTIAGMYRVDSAPVVLLVFILVLVMIIKPEFIYRFGSSLGQTALPLTRRKKSFLVTCLLLPLIVLYVYTLVIPVALLGSPFQNSEKSWNDMRKDFYQLTVIENTLSYILSQKTAVVRPEYRAKIATVYDIDNLIKSYCPDNICYFWNQKWRFESTTEERNEVVRASIGVFLDNPVLFFESRIAHLNTIGSFSYMMSCQNNDENLTPLYKHTSITPLASSIVSYYMSVLENQEDLWRSGIWVNVYFYLILCIPIIVTFRITPVISFITLMLFLRTVVVALTAQSGFFTYYSPIYVGIFFMYILWLPILYTYFSRRKDSSQLNA